MLQEGESSTEEHSSLLWKSKLQFASQEQDLDPAQSRPDQGKSPQQSLLILGCPGVSKWLGEVTGPEDRQLHKHKQCNQG